MDWSLIVATAALALSILAGILPTLWERKKYYKDKQVGYARQAADLYFKALSKMHYANNPDTATQEIVYASLMLRTAIGHDKEINRATMAAISAMEEPTPENEEEKAKALSQLLPIMSETVMYKQSMKLRIRLGTQSAKEKDIG